MSRRKVGFMVGKEATPEFRTLIEKAVQQPIEVASEGRAEEAQIVICALALPPYFFHDDVFTVCADCEVAIRHRPYAPKKPPKVCMECACVRIRNYQEHDT